MFSIVLLFLILKDKGHILTISYVYTFYACLNMLKLLMPKFLPQDEVWLQQFVLVGGRMAPRPGVTQGLGELCRISYEDIHSNIRRQHSKVGTDMLSYQLGESEWAVSSCMAGGRGGGKNLEV